MEIRIAKYQDYYLTFDTDGCSYFKHFNYLHPKISVESGIVALQEKKPVFIQTGVKSGAEMDFERMDNAEEISEFLLIEKLKGYKLTKAKLIIKNISFRYKDYLIERSPEVGSLRFLMYWRAERLSNESVIIKAGEVVLEESGLMFNNIDMEQGEELISAEEWIERLSDRQQISTQEIVEALELLENP